MACVAILLGICGLVIYFSGVLVFDQMKRTLQGEADYLSARILDIQRKISSTHQVQQGRMRQQDDLLNNWMVEGEKLVEKVQHLLEQIGNWRFFFLSVKVRWDVSKLLSSLKVHDRKGDMLLRQALSDAHGYHIPVNQLVGQVASRTLDQLKLLLEGDEFGRIAIHGIGGIGKTFTMKHLHNWALKGFDYVLWVPSPVVFTVKSVQDAVAVVVHCDFANDDALSVRAAKLSDTLAKLGRFVILLDGVPNGNFSLEQVGIPVPAERSKCKVVLSTSFSLECQLLDSFKAVEITRLRKEDAYELFSHRANIGKGPVTSLDGIPSLLADGCCGLSRIIENTATRMCGINDLCEWRNALVELERPGRRNSSTRVQK